MKAGNEETVRVLKYAIEQESETRDFYRSCLKRVATDGVKEILKGLAEDEQRHYDILQRMLNDVSGGEKASVKMQPAEAAKVRLERAFTRTAIDDPDFAPENQDVRGVLQKALDIEKESFDNYSKAARDSADEELRSFFGFLAGEENMHYVIIDNLMTYLEVPDKWLYTEENLVFQNG